MIQDKEFMDIEKNEKAVLREGERLDDLQRMGYQIIQHPGRFCFGMDAVLLSHFATVKKGSRVLDMGTGTGVLPLLLCALSQDSHFDALEIQEESVDMATRSVLWNGLEERICVTQGDIKDASRIYGRQVFDAVVTNPPYMNDGRGLVNPDLPRAIARHEIYCTLDDLLREAAAVLKPKKSLFLVHRPQRLPEIFQTMRRYHLEPKRMQMVHPYIHREPSVVLIEAVRDGSPFLRTEPPIIVYQDTNVYTQQILDMYK